MDEKLILDAMTRIRDYLLAHPESADTLEGIHHYWICWPVQPEAPFVTQAALELLLESDFVECMHYGNRTVWRRRREKDESGG